MTLQGSPSFPAKSSRPKDDIIYHSCHSTATMHPGTSPSFPAHWCSTRHPGPSPCPRSVFGSRSGHHTTAGQATLSSSRSGTRSRSSQISRLQTKPWASDLGRAFRFFHRPVGNDVAETAKHGMLVGSGSMVLQTER